MLQKIFLMTFVILLSKSAVAADENVLNLEKQFESKFLQHFTDSMKVSHETFDVKVENLIFYPQLTTSKNSLTLIELMGIGGVGFQRMEGLFSLTATIKNNVGHVSEHQVSGLLSVNGPVWVTRENLNRGKRIEESDLVLMKLPWKTLASGVALNTVSEMVGRSVARFVGRGTPLSRDHLEAVHSVNVGDVVELTVRSGPGVMIRSRAVARQRGRVGEFIRVEHSDTKKPLQALITGDKQVGVHL